MKQMKIRLTALVLALAMMLSCGIHVFAVEESTLSPDLIYEIGYDDELDLGTCMIEDLEVLMKDDLDYVEFTIPTDAGDCGEIYYYYATNQWEVVYAVLVQNADDLAAALYTRICGRELPPVNTDQQTADQIAAELQPVTVEIDQIAAVKDAVYAALTAQNGNASYDVVLPDFSLDGAAGEKTLEGVLVTVQVGEATAQTTISITVLY